MKRDDATQRQVRAASPGTSTWLSANAGSGKTRVLTDRVARLLLGGTRPQHILCLTYTKAAASEMQNRLFKTLGAWSMLSDDDLRAELKALGVEETLDSDRLRHSRTLFASAIEAPGGLKIQTIHSFCASILRRFPMEAGISPQFAEMEDRATAILSSDVLDDLASGPDGQVVEDLARLCNDHTLPDVVKRIVSNKSFFAEPLDRDQLATVLGLPPGYDAACLEANVFSGSEGPLLYRVAAALTEGSKNDRKAADALKSVGIPDAGALPTLEKVFLFAAGQTPGAARIGKFPTKAGQGLVGDDLPALEQLMLRVEAARPRRLALAALDKTMVLHRFANAFLPGLEKRKQDRGWLDFDDLIQVTRRLLRTPGIAEWVLYRLDGGIDHILVDEAQDTSPEQWDIVESLAREFFSGEGARPDVVRTLFVVGDKKQSIYSFQGADPDSFDRMQALFRDRFEDSKSPFQSLSLDYSFRSSSAILELVDTVFGGVGTSPQMAPTHHLAYWAKLPGRVDLWPAVEPAEQQDDRDWTDPVDLPGKRHHTVVLAERIAGFIADMIAGRVPAPGDTESRGVSPGDILILLQRRTTGLFDQIVRACKELDLPIAGSDRLRVAGELAVRDVLSVLRFLSTPEDDLSLAEALRSPLFGWDEQALFDLAHRRSVPRLWQAMRDRHAEFAADMRVLEDLRDQTDYLRPFELIERLLTRHRGRPRLLARRGQEAEDGIDALLSQALAYEATEVPSLTGFLAWMEADDLEIKRQADLGGGLIRIMTVHGAKGLEAPVVILPDTGVRKPPSDPAIEIVDGIPVWRVGVSEAPEPLLTARAARQENTAAERDRLLYVALTRAESWLVIAGAGDVGGPGESWYSTSRAALEQLGAREVEMPGGTGLRFGHQDVIVPAEVATGRVQRLDPDVAKSLPPFLEQDVPPPASIVQPLAASSLGGAKALPSEAGLDSDEATARGTAIHLLLESLASHPPKDWPMLADLLLPDGGASELLAEVGPILSNPEFAFLFGPDTLAEVPVVGDIGGRRVIGILDRLVPGPDRVLVVDYKSNRAVPDIPEACPEGILRQLGAYAHILGQVYPNRAIETAVLWTVTGRLMRLPHKLVSDALARAPLT